MAGNKYISNNSGAFLEVAGQQTSAGVADASKIVALDSTGKLDLTLMPTGIGPDTATIVTSEALSAGDLVNVWSNGGVFNVRKADASTAGKEAHGYVLASVLISGNALVYFEGPNNQMSGLTPGNRFLSVTTPGITQATAPSVAGQVVQVVGFATALTTMNFQSRPPITLA